MKKKGSKMGQEGKILRKPRGEKKGTLPRHLGWEENRGQELSTIQSAKGEGLLLLLKEIERGKNGGNAKR